jgi:hypothetical protein
VVVRNARVHTSSSRTSTVLQAFVEDSEPPQTPDYSAYQTSNHTYPRPQTPHHNKSHIKFNPKHRLDLKQYYQPGSGNPLRLPKPNFNSSRSVTIPNKRPYPSFNHQPPQQTPSFTKRQFLDKDAFQRYKQERDAARREADRIVREKYFKVNAAVSQEDEDPPDDDLIDNGLIEDDPADDDLTEEQFLALRAEAYNTATHDGSTSTTSNTDLINIFSS